MVGITLGEEETILYILEPEPSVPNQRRAYKAKTNRQNILKRVERPVDHSCIQCNQIKIGSRTIQIKGGTAGSIGHAESEPGVFQLFFTMLSAGWKVPEWLKKLDWAELRLVKLELVDVKRLPSYTPDVPIVLHFRTDCAAHLAKKTVTLTVNQPTSFEFICHTGEKVQCHINSVSLSDPWAEAEQKFQDPRYLEHFSPEQVEALRANFFADLAENCPKGMCYLAVEYECEKDLSLEFYSKAYLKAPVHHTSSSLFFVARPDKRVGTHGMPLKAYILNEPMVRDVEKIPAELLVYYEPIPEFEIAF